MRAYFDKSFQVLKCLVAAIRKQLVPVSCSFMSGPAHELFVGVPEAVALVVVCAYAEVVDGPPLNRFL